MSDHIEPILLKLKRRKKKEKAFVVAVETRENQDYYDEMFRELLELCYSANAEVAEIFTQKRANPDPGTLIGRGKLDEIETAIREQQPDLIIFMNDLRPGQERTLTDRFKIRVIDRQALILDIFAQRARTREGKMQVELALLNYLLPRLAGLGPVLSRLGGGIGTRGPGETMLETDRRHVMKRIETLRKDLNKLRSHRELLRESRHNKGFLVSALVGYTNAGKSTILNSLTRRNVRVEDKLFATLDPTVGKYYLGNGLEMLLADTVGFIRHLPHHLTAAFRATLEEVEEADVIIHIIDISNPRWAEQMNVTEQVLEEMACDNKPTILVFNKIDLVTGDELSMALRDIPSALPVSAVERAGFDGLTAELARIADEYFPDFVSRFARSTPGTGDEWYREYETGGSAVE